MPDFFVCAHKSGPQGDFPWREIAREISPDNIQTRVTTYTAGACRLTKTDCPESGQPEHEATLGHRYRHGDGHDGSYAYVRVSAGEIELEADGLSSKTLWYYQDDSRFFASTSQRAIIMAKGSFLFNPDAVYAFLNTGILGQGLSWDREIRCLEANGNLVFDVERWRLAVSRREAIPFYQDLLPRRKRREALEAALDEVFARFDVDPQVTVLPLSGGYDSRFLLLSLLDRGQPISTITWGHPSSLEDPENDAVVAQDLARDLDVPHRFYPTFTTEESLETRVSRFIRLGEGRIENMNAYLDGFALWAGLRDAGTSSIIRGDEVFGWSPVDTVRDVLNSCALLAGDMYDNHELMDRLMTAPEHSPGFPVRRDGETLAQWRDRLYQDCMVPRFYAPLNYLKQKYVDVYTPYYADAIVKIVRRLPDEDRTAKRLFRKLVDGRYRGIPYAKKPANIQFEGVFSDREFLELAEAGLSDLAGKQLLSSAGVRRIRSALMQASSGSAGKRPSIATLMPARMKSWIKRSGLYRQSYYLEVKRVALRLLITQLVDDLFREDANRMKAWSQ